jgi:hypothetical protein
MQLDCVVHDVELPFSSPLSFYLLEYVKQVALDSIEQKANENYNNLMLSRDRGFSFRMGVLCGVKTFTNINANVSLVDEEVFSNEAMD